MLNQRQIEILLELCNHTEEYLTASYFADKLNVSLRTVQGDMKAIKTELEEESCAHIESKASKGSCIVVEDADEFSAFVNSLYQEYTTVSLNYPTSRISKILLLLLSRHRAVTLSEMEEKYFVSKSTLLNDLKKVEEVLDKFHLELMHGSNKVMVDGFEINKRRCLAEQDLYLAHIKNEHGMSYIDERQLAKIKNILTEKFVEHQYHIMDTDFNNAILFLNIMICRMGDGFYVQSNELDITENLGKEYEMSKDIFEKIGRRFFIKVTDEEIKYFALYLKGQGNNRDSDTITPEMDKFITEAFAQIKENFGVDFTDNINLRITLALHCMSLQIRIKYDMQMKNDMLDYIRETFPMGYDIGTYFAFLLSQKYGKKVSDDETALLAVHFYSSLMELNSGVGKIKILVISSLKNSMTLLLKQSLLRWFSDRVSAVDFCNPMDVTEDMLDEYDIFLTTEKDEFFEKGLAMYVNAFPNQHDYANIKLNLDGFKDIEDIASILETAKIKPMVNQILLHISNTPMELVEYCQKNGIAVEAYSQIAHGEILNQPEIKAMADKYGVTVPQLCIRYTLQLGTITLPKTGNPDHMKSNAEVDFEINAEDMEILKNFKKIESYGESGIFPVYGGKM